MGIQLSPVAGPADGPVDWADILYSAPDWESNPVPTRSGHPILFPFPGRLRDGTFTFEGKTFTTSAQRLHRNSTPFTASLLGIRGA